MFLPCFYFFSQSPYYDLELLGSFESVCLDMVELYTLKTCLPSFTVCLVSYKTNKLQLTIATKVHYIYLVTILK